MKFTLIAIILIAQTTWAKTVKSDWELKSGKLTYHVSFPLKKVEGVSSEVRGKGHCTTGTCDFLIAAPLKSFISGDGNRDNHMLEVTRAADFPLVVVHVKCSEPQSSKRIDANVEIEFAGKKHTYTHINMELENAAESTVAKGRIPLLLSDFDVERPSLLTVKVEDAVPVDFEMTWR